MIRSARWHEWPCAVLERLEVNIDMKLLPLAGIFALTITASFADTIDATTPCSVAIQAFELRQARRAGPRRSIVASRRRCFPLKLLELEGSSDTMLRSVERVEL